MAREVLNSDNSSSVVSNILNTLNKAHAHECLNEAVRMLIAHPMKQETDDHVPGHTNSIPGIPRMKLLAYKVQAIWSMVRRRVCDSDMPGALVTDKMGLGNTFTSGAAAMICKLTTENL